MIRRKKMSLELEQLYQLGYVIILIFLMPPVVFFHLNNIMLVEKNTRSGTMVDVGEYRGSLVTRDFKI